MNFRLAALVAVLAGAAGASQAAEPVIGLITKTDTNPYFVTMQKGAKQEAAKLGAKLITASGRFDGDNSSQVTALENMSAAGAKTILITPGDSKAIVPTIEKVRKQGVMVIALDSPTEPASAVNALYATDNYQAGELIGAYAAKVMKGKKPVIATLDLFPGSPVGAQRHNGFMKGFGLPAAAASSNELSKDSDIVCMADTDGDQAKGQTAMQNCLQKNPNINLVYAINEPAAAGAYQALKQAGREKGVAIVAIDGGCKGVEQVAQGIITATAQQYPLKMAALGVEAGVDYAKTGKMVSGYHNTGVNLITDKPIAGVASHGTKFGMRMCWGNR
ncbi:MAG: sugar ABC transporter substrate-binding protein [Betaproteobacteria bacterium]|nr:sugar ABC transporter substrate-binding protein [Betaproteobacteria bacterium]MDE1954520.1 sugar ABC transporter substrate-binding protein [Betaproteobacteria bacterium]MDE2151899.1 sugar ABC transporter substrate-binding protein [Betaproteobacteria bacterium]